MSEHQQQPPQYQHPFDALQAGDKEAAQRLFDARNERDGIGEGAGENNEPTPSEPFPEPAPAAQVDYVAEAMRAQPDGDHWIEQLGGAGSPDLAQNVALAVAGYERLARDMPHVIEAFTGTIEREDGTTFSPGDDPSLIFHLARYERFLRARGGDALPAPFPTMRDAKMDGKGNQQQQPATPSGGQSIQDRIAAIYREHPPGSEGYKRPDIQRTLAALFKAQTGDLPAVGSGGRNA